MLSILLEWSVIIEIGRRFWTYNFHIHLIKMLLQMTEYLRSAGGNAQPR